MACGDLHGAEVVESGDEKLVASERHLDRVPCKRRVSGVSIDAGDPLHDVPAVPGPCSAGVGALGELVGIQRDEWEFVGRKGGEADMLGVDLGEQLSESREICTVWIGDDVEVSGGAHVSVNADGDASDDHEPDASAGQGEEQLIGPKHRAVRLAGVRRLA